MVTPRAARPDTTVRLDPDLAQITLCPSGFGPLDMDDTHLLIRRAGGCEDDWLVAYRPFDSDTAGNVSFRFDDALHALEPAYYDAVVMEGCTPCGLIRMDKTKRPSLHMRAVRTMAFKEVPPPGGALPGTGYSTMLDSFVNWTSKLDCALGKTDLTIKTTDDLPAIPAGATVQLVVRDGVAVETVTVTATSDGTLTVTRGNPAYAFPKDACIQFEWTIENIRTVANEDCPTVVDPVDPTDPATTTTALLEAGKGLQLQTDDAGRIVISLEQTGVAPGQYGGMEVDDCGRVTVVDASFPANALPVFDTCAKD